MSNTPAPEPEFIFDGVYRYQVHQLEHAIAPTAAGDLIAVKSGAGAALAFYVAGMQDGRLVWFQIARSS